MAGQRSIVEYVGTAIRNRNAQGPLKRYTQKYPHPSRPRPCSSSRNRSRLRPIRDKQVCMYSISYSPRVKLAVTGKLGGEWSRSRGMYYDSRCFRPLRQVAANICVMKGPASDEQALHGTTCGIYCRRPGRSAPNLPPAGNRSRRRRGVWCCRRGERAAQE